MSRPEGFWLVRQRCSTLVAPFLMIPSGRWMAPVKNWTRCSMSVCADWKVVSGDSVPESPARLQRGQPISVLWSEVLHVRQSVSDLALFWAYVYNMRLVIGSFAHRNLPDISGYGGATRGDSDCCCCCCRLRELCLPIAAMVHVFPVRHPGGCNGDPGLHQSAALRSFQKMRGVAWLGTLTWSCERLSNA